MARIATPKALPTDADRFDAERWIKATNLYWQEVVAALVASLNQVASPGTAPTKAEVKAGVVAKYKELR